MLKIEFKNLDPSELAREITREHLGPILSKFPSINPCKITVTLEAKKTLSQDDADLFEVSVSFKERKGKAIAIKHSSSSLYESMSMVAKMLLEHLEKHKQK